MLPSTCLRASITRKPKFGGPVLPLDYVRSSSPPNLDSRSPPSSSSQFVTRTKTLALYRSFIRSTKGLGDAVARRETVLWIRADFERYKDVVESDKAKTLLALGNRQLKQLNSTGMLIGYEGAKWRGGRVKS